MPDNRQKLDLGPFGRSSCGAELGAWYWPHPSWELSKLLDVSCGGDPCPLGSPSGLTSASSVLVQCREEVLGWELHLPSRLHIKHCIF